MEGDKAAHSSTTPQNAEAEAASGSRPGADEKPATGAEAVADVPDPDEDDLDDLDGKFPWPLS